MPLPEVDQLRCFVAAAEALSFRRAARSVRLTPAALGKQIKRLEERLGRVFFSRTTRSVQLTPDGEQLLEKARHALEAVASCAQFDGEQSGLSGEVTVGSRHELALSWLAPFTRRMLVKRPKLHLNLYIGSGPDLLLRVRTGEIDCAITSSRLSDAALEFERLHDEKYVFVASRRLLKSQPLSLAKHAAAHTLLDSSIETPLFRYWRDEAPLGLELGFRRVLHLGTIAIIRDYVQAGLGVAVLPLYFVRADLMRRRLAMLFPQVQPATDAFRLVFRRADRRRGLFRELAALLRTEPLR